RQNKQPQQAKRNKILRQNALPSPPCSLEVETNMQEGKAKRPQARGFAEFDEAAPAEIRVQRGHAQAEQQKADCPLAALKTWVESPRCAPVRTAAGQYKNHHRNGEQIEHRPTPV